MRWKVGISGFTCEPKLIESVGKGLGYSLRKSDETYYLYGYGFESKDDHNLVWEEANRLKDMIKNIEPLLPIQGMAFNLDHVLEIKDDGSRRKHHFGVVVMPATAKLTLKGYAPSVFVGTQEEIEKQQKEIEEQKKRKDVHESVKLIATALKYEEVQLVLDLQKGQLNPLTMGHIFDLIRDDIGGDIKSISNKTQITRFTRSINHPDVFGEEARHIVSYQSPPTDPMKLAEAREFIIDLVNKWVEGKFKKITYN